MNMNFISEENRIYINNEANEMVGEVTFPTMYENVVNINHTYVADSLRGQGIAGNLLEQTAIKLRSEHKKAYATCSYAIKWFHENLTYSDVFIDIMEHI